jgi:hypothetical protein
MNAPVSIRPCASLYAEIRELEICRNALWSAGTDASGDMAAKLDEQVSELRDRLKSQVERLTGLSFDHLAEVM